MSEVTQLASDGLQDISTTAGLQSLHSEHATALVSIAIVSPR